ncbi:transcriptional regulator, IclR family [Desulfocicer vacuolatum DSM 3385]|uniref:Transcriptional regulator, IclR family n=1 Tax=Desulfocicer vacuolatum DSM 3385 TaxID=1121400 RepID=A0A1W2CK88_9BACT|nr:IclR family transcriptional regulator [Desulfocicer vacuolatum]SMC85600.1 transcriptional regulator, IclR family [Desulfocicer vacuolatum DSM 3385]
MKQNNDHKKYNAIEKSILTLLAFSEDKSSWGVRELSQKLGFSPATVQRILQTYKTYGFVKQDSQTRQYHLGNVFYKFIEPLQHVNQVTRGARKYMEQVAAETGETVHLNIVEDGHRICIDTLESSRALRAGMPLGHRSPLHAGASAKCLLAFSSPEFIETYLDLTPLTRLTENTLVERTSLEQALSQIRQEGFAGSLGERTPGLGSLSAPIMDHRGKAIAVLSLAIPEIRFSNDVHRNKCIESLIGAVREFSLENGFLFR